MVAMYVLRKGGSAIEAFGDVAWQLTELLVQEEVWLASLHWIPTTTNSYTDALTHTEAERELAISDQVWT